MPFSPLFELPISPDWQVSEPTTANYFRLHYLENQGFSYLLIAQAQVGTDGLELFESRRFPIRTEIDLLKLEIPPIFNPDARRIAVRGLAPKSARNPTLTLKLEAQFMAIINPSNLPTTQIKQTEVKQDSVTATEIPANQNRNSGIIMNKGNKRLFVGFGFAADSGSPFVLQPGGNMDFPTGFTGTISILWSALDPNQVVNKSICFVDEFVA
jgi:hypothetical protein